MSTPDAERLTWDDICARYPDEWVLLTDAEFADDPELNITSARVAAHDRSSQPVMDALDEVRPTQFAILYTGEDPVPADVAVIL